MITESRILELVEFEKNIDYEFKNKSLLSQAFTHSSYSNENQTYKNLHNERLEFLGDAVLELVFSKILYYKYKNRDEGFLTKRRSKLVCEKSFAYLADKFEISKYLLLGKGEDKTGGREKYSIKADALEAMCGAMYIDGGFDFVFNFINKNFKDLEYNISKEEEDFFDYKSILQEYIHRNKKGEFKYILSKDEGPAHSKTFYMDVYLNSKLIGTGIGKNKKDAEQHAAKEALRRFGVINE